LVAKLLEVLIRIVTGIDVAYRVILLSVLILMLLVYLARTARRSSNRRSENPTFIVRRHNLLDTIVISVWQSLRWPDEVVPIRKVRSWAGVNPMASATVITETGQIVGGFGIWGLKAATWRQLIRSSSGGRDVASLKPGDFLAATDTLRSRRVYVFAILHAEGVHQGITTRFSGSNPQHARVLRNALLFYARRVFRDSYPLTIYAIPYNGTVLNTMMQGNFSLARPISDSGKQGRMEILYRRTVHSYDELHEMLLGRSREGNHSLTAFHLEFTEEMNRIIASARVSADLPNHEDYDSTEEFR
jgi:hypothetical protein